MTLNSLQFKQLQQQILKHFKLATLRRCLRFELETNLDQVASAQTNLTEVIYTVIEHFARHMSVLQEQWQTLDDQPNAQLLLRVAGLLGKSEQLPIARLGLLTGFEDDVDERLFTLSDAVEKLVEHTLAEQLDDEHIHIHLLIGDFVQQQISRDELGAFVSVCAEKLLAVYEDLDKLGRYFVVRGIKVLQFDVLLMLRFLTEAQVHSTLTERVHTLSHVFY